MSDLVLRKDTNGATTLSLNRPETLNALNVELFRCLDAHVRDIAARTDTIGVVVLRGAGRCFSSGHDLADLDAGEELPTPNFQAEVIERLAGLPQPMITAVHGHCYTGALELALAGDLIIAAESARFADTHAKWSLVPIWGLSQRLPRRIGAYKAREMMFTCRTYTGREAEAMGLANVCVPDERFEAELSTLVESILANSWHSHRANKQLLMQTDGLPLEAGLAQEIYRSAGFGPDSRDRIAAFLSARKKAKSDPGRQ